MLQALIAEHNNLLHQHEALKDKYDKSEKACQEFKMKNMKLIDEHAMYKNKYTRIRRNFECICILYVILGALYHVDLIETQIFYMSTITMILLSFVMF